MNRSIAFAILLAAALSGCEWGKSTTSTVGAACTSYAGACGRNADCCSYSCQSGLCAANPVEGGLCRTTNDCALSRLCKSGRCTTPTAGMCRDNSDVCSSPYWCCSGNCVTASGTCEPNHPPVAAFTVTWDGGTATMGSDGVVPFRTLITLQNGSTDPDSGDVNNLVYGWVLSRPTGSSATLSPSTTATSPTFTADLAGDYRVQLTVTDGPTGQPGRMTSTVFYDIHARNVPPVATVAVPADTVWPGAPAGTWSRNVPVTFTGTASDPDGDTFQCAWRVTLPGATPVPIDTLTFGSCAFPSNPYTAAVEGLYQVDLIVRDSAALQTIATTTFTSRNDAPTPVVKPNASTQPNPPTAQGPFYANLGPPAGTNPTVTLDASLSWDRNGDTPLAYQWEIRSAADGLGLPSFTDSGQATQTFVPDRATDYVVRVTVSDPVLGTRAAASTPLDVTVKVGRYVQPLAHDFADAAYAKTADKIVTVGHDPADATKGMLWVYDVATATEAAGISLVDGVGNSGIPKLVGVSPDGTRVVAVDWVSSGTSVWIVTNPSSPTPGITRLTRPFDVGELVVAGPRFAYLFAVLGGSYAVQEVDMQNPGIAAGLGSTAYAYHGASSSGASTPWLYRTDPTWGYVWRYDFTGAGANWSSTSTTAFTCGTAYPAFWATLDNQYLVTSCGGVYSATTNGSVQTLQDGSAPPQTVSPSWIDSITTGPLLAVDGSRTSLHRYSGTLQFGGTDVLPRWGLLGVGHTLSARKAFLNSAGTKRIAVVSDTATPTRHGIVTYP